MSVETMNRYHGLTGALLAHAVVSRRGKLSPEKHRKDFDMSDSITKQKLDALILTYPAGDEHTEPTRAYFNAGGR